MKTILCYGDSNTWGYDASTGGRFPPETRWPKVLQRELGERLRGDRGGPERPHHRLARSRRGGIQERQKLL